MTFFWIVVIIVVVWYLATRSKKSGHDTFNENALEKEEDTDITEETVFKVQSRFENKLETEVDFPDGIRGFSAYVYNSLMTVWYKQLAGENRYDEKMTQKLRSDWLDYMDSMEERATCAYLYMETPEEEKEKSDSYSQRAFMATKKMTAIEDGFASAVGKEAVEELDRARKIREENFSKFDKLGNLAPEGFEYDYNGELREERKTTFTMTK